MRKNRTKRLCACGCGRSIQPYVYRKNGNKGYGSRKYATDCDRVDREFLGMNFSPTDLAWTAGIIDGEGCIHIRGSKDTRQTRSHLPKRHVLSIDVVNTDPRMIKKLHTLFGGWAGITRRKTETRKIKYRWTLSSSRAAAVLRLVSPYIVTKPEEVQTALAYALTVRGEHVGEDVFLLRENYKQRLIALHHWRAESQIKQKTVFA